MYPLATPIICGWELGMSVNNNPLEYAKIILNEKSLDYRNKTKDTLVQDAGKDYKHIQVKSKNFEEPIIDLPLQKL